MPLNSTAVATSAIVHLVLRMVIIVVRCIHRFVFSLTGPALACAALMQRGTFVTKLI
ncbi:hypothetical protein ACVIW0_001605 [Bradyrhizobium sp. USDA 4454]